MGLFFTAWVLWFLCFSFVPHFISSSRLLFSFKFLPPSLYPLSHSFLLSLVHWRSEPKETLSHQVQVTCLPGGKPRSRKLQPCAAGLSRRGVARVSAPPSCRAGLDPSVLVSSHHGSQPSPISARCLSLAHSTTGASLLHVVILRQGTRVGEMG